MRTDTVAGRGAVTALVIDGLRGFAGYDTDVEPEYLFPSPFVRMGSVDA